jgi:hypothetical protein
LWQSDTNTGIVKPAVVIKKSKHFLQPFSSMALLLPDWFAYNNEYNIYYELQY